MKRFFILIATLSLVCLTSCVKDVILDAGENPQVVVDCILSNDDVQKLYLCFTKGASRDEADPLTEAVATLIDLTEGKTVGQFVKSESDLWTLDYTPIPMHHYRLEVQVPGYDLIYAEDVMPELVDIYAQTREVTWASSWIPSFAIASGFKGTIFSIISIHGECLVLLVVDCYQSIDITIDCPNILVDFLYTLVFSNQSIRSSSIFYSSVCWNGIIGIIRRTEDDIISLVTF